MIAPQNPKVYKVKRPDGQIWDIPEHNLDQAITLGGEVIDDFDNQPSSSVENTPQTQEKMFMVKRPDGQMWEVPQSNLEKAKQLGGKVIEEEDSTYNDAGRLTARSAKTIGAAATGGVIDVLTSPYNIPASLENAKTPEMKANSPSLFNPDSPFPEPSPYPDAQLPLIPSAELAIEHSIDEATGGFTKTQEGDSIQKGLQLGATVLSPGGLAKGAAKAGLEGTSKVLGALGTTNPTGVASAAATGVGQSEAEKAGFGGAASAAIGLGAGAATSLAASLRPENVKLALATLTGNSPKNINLSAVKSFEEAGLPYSNTTVNESRGLALVDQLISKTPHYGTKQAQTLKVNDKAYEIAVDEAISRVGDRILHAENPSQLEIGDSIQHFFEGTKDIIKDIEGGLYATQRELLPKNAEAMPNFISQHTQEIKDTIKTLRASTDEKFLLEYLSDLEKSIFAIEEVQATKLALTHDLELKFVPNTTKGKKTLQEIPVELMVGTNRSLNDIINWDVNSTGIKNQLKHIKGGVLKDIEAFGNKNPEWYDAFQKANKFHGEKQGSDALGNKELRKKIFGQQNPEKILDSLNDISDFKAMEQALNVTEKGTKFFDSIKRQKLTDLVMGKTINTAKESVNFSGFQKVMESRKTRELVKYLAGDNYQDLQKFLNVAKAAVQRNARIPNPSGTAPTYTIINSFIGSFTGAGSWIAGMKATGGSLAAGMISAHALNWFITNKSALKWGIEAAKKQATGKAKEAATLSNRIERSMTQDMGEDFVRQFMALSSQDE